MTDAETEVWFRDPQLYVRESLELGVSRFSWARKFLVYRKIDPMKYLSLHYGQVPFEYLICDDMGTQHWVHNNPKPIAVYPTWLYGDDWAVLEELCTYEPGMDSEACNDERIPYNFRPKMGQQRRVVIMGAPSAVTGIGRKFYQVLSELQEDSPYVNIHIHGSMSFNIMFGLNFRSVDYDGRHYAHAGKIVLPNGKLAFPDSAEKIGPWVNVLGFTPGELSVPRNRCMFNMKSALWAAKHFKQELRFKYKRDRNETVDSESEDANFTPPSTKSAIFLKRVTPQDGDKFLCDTCSLQLNCRYFRTGSVCIVPDAEPQELASYFKTRDADSIIDGLGTLLAAQTRRLERGMSSEDTDDAKLDPEVTKILNSLFDRAVQLAKLVNPNLASPKVQINQQTINTGSPQQLMAAIMAELEARGIPRDQITPEMIESVLSGNNRAAIEAQVVE